MVKLPTWYKGLCVTTFVLILLIVVGQKADQFGKELTADVEQHVTIPAQEQRARLCESLKQVTQDEQKYVPLSALEKYCGEKESTNRVYFNQLVTSQTFGT